MTDLEKVKKNWHYLLYVRDQTPEICLEAMKQTGSAFRFINELNEIDSQTAMALFSLLKECKKKAEEQEEQQEEVEERE